MLSEALSDAKGRTLPMGRVVAVSKSLSLSFVFKLFGLCGERFCVKWKSFLFCTGGSREGIHSLLHTV